MKRLVAGVLFVCALFFASWVFLSRSIPLWGDEPMHYRAGVGLLRYGAPLNFDLDLNAPTDSLYTRGLIVTKLIAASFERLGISLSSSRLPSLAFVLATFALFLLFLLFSRREERVTADFAALSVILFLGQAGVLEQALYARFYAGLGLATVFCALAYWKIKRFCLEKKYLAAVLLSALALFAVRVPFHDGWQFTYVLVIAVGVLLDVACTVDRIKALAIRRQKELKALLFLFVLSCPFLVRLLQKILVSLPPGLIPIRGANWNLFVTYWDNVIGTIKYAVVLNVVLLPVLRPKLFRSELKWGLGPFLYFAGIVGGFLETLLTNSNHIFYDRYFYEASVLAILGFSLILHSARRRGMKAGRILAIYLATNALFSGMTFVLDRSTIIKAIALAKQELRPEDALLVHRPRFVAHGGEELVQRSIFLETVSRYREIPELISELNASPAQRVFFLYDDEYGFRDGVYHLITGKHRVPGGSDKDLFRYIRDLVPRQKSYAGLRNSGLVVFDRQQLIRSLEDLRKIGSWKL